MNPFLAYVAAAGIWRGWLALADPKPKAKP
jgi:hypothetical protein